MTSSIGARLLKPVSRVILLGMDHMKSARRYFDVEIRGELSETPRFSKDLRDEKIRRFFDEAFADRFWRYIPLSVIIIGLFIFDLYSIITFGINLQVYGLILDVIGASVLARGLIRGVVGIKRDTHKDAGYWGVHYNTSSLTSVAQNTTDGIFGTAFLVSGCILQIIAIL